jgi:ABC-2 type transport system permease protein
MRSTLQDLRVLAHLRALLILRESVFWRKGESRRNSAIKIVVTLLVSGWVLYTIVGPLTGFLRTWLSGAKASQNLAASLSWGLSVVTLVIFFYAVVALITTLTYSGDLKLLLLSPISPRLIMGMKIFSASLGFAPILLVLLPGVVAAGHALHLDLAYDITAVVMVLLLPLAPVSLAMLLILAVLRWLPPARARAIATLLGTLLGAAFFIGTQLLAERPGGGARRSTSIPNLPAWLPTTWPGRALADAGLGRSLAASAYLLGTLLFIGLLFGVATDMSARLFSSGSATFQEVQRRKRGAKPRRRSRKQTIRLDVPTPTWWPLFSKEWRVLRRDSRQISLLLYPFLLTAYYGYRAVSVGRPHGDDLVNAVLLNASFYALLTFVTILLTGSLAPSSFNREGRSLYLLALAPLSLRDLLVAKWAVATLPVLCICEVLLGVVSVFLQIPPVQAVVAAAALAMLVGALAGAAIITNLAWPRLQIEGPIRKQSVLGGVAGSACEFAIGGIFCALLIIGFLLWPRHAALAAATIALLFVIMAGVNAAVLFFGPNLVGRLFSRAASRDI